MDESKCPTPCSYLSLYSQFSRQRRLTPCFFFFLYGRISSKFRLTAPKLRTSSVVKTGFVVSLVSPTSRLKPNPSPIPLHPTQPPLLPPLGPDQNPISAPLHYPQTQTGALLSCPATATPMPISPPRVSRPPYQVSFPPPYLPLYSPMLFDP